MSTGSHRDFTRTLAKRTRFPAARGTTLTRRRIGRRKGEVIPNPGAVLQLHVQAQTRRRTTQDRTTQVRTGPGPSQLHARADREVFATPVVALVTPRISALPRGKPVDVAKSQDTSRMCARHRRRSSTLLRQNRNRSLLQHSRPTQQRWLPLQRWSCRKLLLLRLRVFSPRLQLSSPCRSLASQNRMPSSWTF